MTRISESQEPQKPVKDHKYKCPECGSLNIVRQAGDRRCLDCEWNLCVEA